MASRGRHAGSCSAMVDTGGRGRRCHRRIRCLPGSGTHPYARRTPFSYAVRGYRLRLSGIDDSGRLSFQDRERPYTTLPRLDYAFEPVERNDRRRHDGGHDHSGDGLGPHCSEDSHGPHRDSAAHRDGLTTMVVAMIAVSAMACQFALLRLAVPGAPSTAVMTGNLTSGVLSLLDTL